MVNWRALLAVGLMLEAECEELVDDLEAQAHRLVAHCSLDWDDACLKFHKTEGPVLTASMIQARQLIYRGTVGRWRQYKELLGPLLRELGVDPSLA
jgi:hypothetical protein